MILQKSARFLMIFLCIMSVHNVVFAGYKEIAEACGDYYTKSARKYIDLTSNGCKACLMTGSNLVLVKLGSDVLKYCINSESADFLNLGSACNGAGEGVSFEDFEGFSTSNVLSVAKCDTCPANTYVLAYNDVKHQNDYLTQVYNEYELNECVTCAGTDYRRYYTEDGECKPCPDGYRCDNTFSCDMLKDGAWGGLDKCGLCVEDDYGMDGNDCKKCSTSGKVSIVRTTQSTTQSMTGPGVAHQVDRNHNECIEKSECNTVGYGGGTGFEYGVNEEKNTCEKCETGKVSQADENGIYRCVENDPCASDTQCTTEGCGKTQGNCVPCSDGFYSLFIPSQGTASGSGYGYNICFNPIDPAYIQGGEQCNRTTKHCQCKAGYHPQPASGGFGGFPWAPAGCYQCVDNSYSENGLQCQACGAKYKLVLDSDGNHIGCDPCGEHAKQKSGDPTKCVCIDNYGRENGACVECIGGKERDDDTDTCKLKTCENNQWLNTVSGNCESCPENFECNGKDKIKCPYGTVRKDPTTSCGTPNSLGLGFLYVTETSELEIKDINEHYNSNDENFLKKFSYIRPCGVLNAIPKRMSLADTMYNNIKENYQGFPIYNTWNDPSKYITVCEKCKDTERAVSDKCVCGESSTNPTSGIITGISGQGTVCQVCPTGTGSGVKIPADSAAPYTCNSCVASGTGFHWIPAQNKFICTPCSETNALYTDSEGLKWCLGHTVLVTVEGEDAHKYYSENSVWTECPAGSCCYNGKKYTCNKGTYSWKGMRCENGVAGACHACGNGKTTESTGTACEGETEGFCKNYLESELCNTFIKASKFCRVQNRSLYSNNMCFDISAVSMDFSSIYNIQDIEPDATPEQ